MSNRRQKRISLKRIVSAIKRDKLTITALSDEDIRWVFAGYKKDAFKGDAPEGLDPNEFIKFVEDVSIGYSRILVMKDRENKVLSLVLVNVITHIVEARTYHMPWCSSAQKLKGAVMYFAGISEDFTGIKYSAPKEDRYCKHLVRYGVLRKVGTVKDFYRNEDKFEDATLYQSNEVKTPWIEPLKIQMRKALKTLD